MNSTLITSYERDNETELDFAQARMYSSNFERFFIPDPIHTITLGRLSDPQEINLYVYSRNNPYRFTDPDGMEIKEGNLTEDQKKKLEDIKGLADLKDGKGNFVHSELNRLYYALEKSSTVFYIDGSDFESSEGRSFEITKIGVDGDSIAEARISLDFDKIANISETLQGDKDANLIKFQGLLGKESSIDRLAEVFGHEAAHAEWALKNTSVAIVNSQLVETDKMYNAEAQKKIDSLSRAEKLKFRHPPEVIERRKTIMDNYNATETYAQSRERIVNAELRASKSFR